MLIIYSTNFHYLKLPNQYPTTFRPLMHPYNLVLRHLDSFQLGIYLSRFFSLETKLVNHPQFFRYFRLSTIIFSRKRNSPPSHQSSFAFPPKFSFAFFTISLSNYSICATFPLPLPLSNDETEGYKLSHQNIHREQ